VNVYQRTIATLLLGVYALTGTSALPALATFLANLDGGHGVTVMFTKAGTHLSLKHQQSDITLTAEDHHSTAGRLVTRLCRNNASGTHELESQQLAPNVSPDRELKKAQEQLPSPLLNHQASWVLAIVTSRPAFEWLTSCQACAASRRVSLPSQWPMTATVQLLL
jgi:hypothetical protein